MSIKKEAVVFLLVATLVLFAGYSTVYGAAGPSGAPWYPDSNPVGKTEYSGNLYVIFLDTGKNFVPCGIGSQTENPIYREYVVEVNFILELYPKGPREEPMYFSGIGKTCEQLDDEWPVCRAEPDYYNDTFYLPGDYVTRIGAALHTFLEETVYPNLCGTGDCFLKDAVLGEGSGNAEDVVNIGIAPVPPPPPWYWVQPLTIVAP